MLIVLYVQVMRAVDRSHYVTDKATAYSPVTQYVLVCLFTATAMLSHGAIVLLRKASLSLPPTLCVSPDVRIVIGSADLL